MSLKKGISPGALKEMGLPNQQHLSGFGVSKKNLELNSSIVRHDRAALRHGERSTTKVADRFLSGTKSSRDRLLALLSADG